MLTDSTSRVTIGGMTQTTETVERHRTPSYRLVETLLRQHLREPAITLEAWVIAQRKLGVAWRPMAEKLTDLAHLDEVGASIGHEGLRRWFLYLEPDEAGAPDEEPH
jgi:hypothetical protein